MLYRLFWWLNESTKVLGHNFQRVCKISPGGIFEISKIKMAAAAILKNRKIAISRPWFQWFWRNLANLAQWRISTLLAVQTVKNLNINKWSKWPVLATDMHEEDQSDYCDERTDRRRCSPDVFSHHHGSSTTQRQCLVCLTASSASLSRSVSPNTSHSSFWLGVSN